MQNKRYQLFTFIFILFISGVTMVYAKEAPSLGTSAKSMLQSVNLFSDFINAACLLIGSCFMFATLIKYLEHRRSPLMVPISTVIFLFIAGIFLLLLPLLHYLQDLNG